MATATISDFVLGINSECRNHPGRKVYAKGFCNSCYRKHRQKHKKEMATCHPERTHAAHGLCRPCYRDKLRENEPIEKRKARWRRAALRANFGLSEADHDRMRLEQGNACAMCRRQFGDKHSNRPHVDHNHATGKVRSLLCTRCNTAVGMFEKHGQLAGKYLDRYDR
jgi:hypothetical protein